jgi:hypothetical protein
VTTTPQDQLEALERQRLAAIGAGNSQAMEPLLADDYVHVNSTGRVIDKAKFLQGMEGRSRETTRGPLTIRVYDDTAVIIGEQTNRTEKAGAVTTTAYVATQVARLNQGRWQLSLMQLTEKEPK